jgi:transcriptional regulator with XRE-family HTH domain
MDAIIRCAGAQHESIGSLLTRLRLEQGKSQLRVAEQLCMAAGVPTITRHEISRWEREKRIPSGTWLPWLAVVLDRPIEQLERARAQTRRHRTTYPRERDPAAAEPGSGTATQPISAVRIAELVAAQPGWVSACRPAWPRR